MKIIGYIRVSTDKQSCMHQRYEIEQFMNKKGLKITNWIEETISSRQSLEKRNSVFY